MERVWGGWGKRKGGVGEVGMMRGGESPGGGGVEGCVGVENNMRWGGVGLKYRLVWDWKVGMRAKNDSSQSATERGIDSSGYLSAPSSSSLHRTDNRKKPTRRPQHMCMPVLTVRFSKTPASRTTPPLSQYIQPHPRPVYKSTPPKSRPPQSTTTRTNHNPHTPTKTAPTATATTPATFPPLGTTPPAPAFFALAPPVAATAFVIVSVVGGTVVPGSVDPPTVVVATTIVVGPLAVVSTVTVCAGTVDGMIVVPGMVVV